jgi:serine/threonine-protein kinase RsbW
MSVLENRVDVHVRGDLAASVLPAVVAMLAARAECPLDRLEEALLLTDAVAAHAPGRSPDGFVRLEVTVDPEGLEMAVHGLETAGAAGLVADATLPDVGGVLERLADEVHAQTGDDAGDRLVLRLRYSAPAPTTMNTGR